MLGPGFEQWLAMWDLALSAQYLTIVRWASPDKVFKSPPLDLQSTTLLLDQSPRGYFLTPLVSNAGGLVLSP